MRSSTTVNSYSSSKTITYPKPDSPVSLIAGGSEGYTYGSSGMKTYVKIYSELDNTRYNISKNMPKLWE